MTIEALAFDVPTAAGLISPAHADMTLFGAFRRGRLGRALVDRQPRRGALFDFRDQFG